MTRTALILGITGSIGGAVAEALHSHGWRLKALHRDPARVGSRTPVPGAVALRHGDVGNRRDVVTAAADCDVIVHAVNPPGYRNWRGIAMPMLANTIAAARASGARILFPGNVYNYGPDAWPLVAEGSPQNPISRKGRVRAEMETMLRDAAGDGARAVVLRAGDFFGPRAPSSWFEHVLVKPGRPVRSITYPGDPNAGHAWAYVPDLAETFARIADREQELGPFETFHFGGHYLCPAARMNDAIRRAAGVPRAPVHSLPWWAIRAASPFNRMFRELLEMRYLWRVSLQLDNRRLCDFLGEEPHTPLQEAVTETLASLQCLPSNPPHEAPA
jgi:nucleoside-diphosphate-sugar epimerase